MTPSRPHARRGIPRLALAACAAAALTLGAVPFRGADAQAAPRTTGRAADDTTPAGPAVGQTAPDFSLAGATRYGLLRNPVRLSDFRGKTVVIAFFYKARTKG